MSTQRFCTFETAGHYFGIAAEAVQEIMPIYHVTRVPRSHPAVRGLMNLRGRVVTVIDLGAELGRATPSTSKSAFGIVLERDHDGAVGLQVDAIGDVVEVEDDLFEPPLDSLGAASALVRGAYRLPDRLLLVLDHARAAQLAETT